MSLYAACTTGFAVAGAVGAVLLDHEVPQKVSALADRSVYHGPGDAKVVALTFDDGPSPQTAAVLDLLAQYDITATFFQTGLQVQRYPGIAKTVSAAGHEIGNHGWSHRSLKPHLHRPVSVPSPRLLYRELARTQELLTTVHGAAPRWFRPPFGHRWLPLDVVAHHLGLRSIQWSVIGHDWEWSADRIAERILDRTTPGAILCLHDGRDVQETADLTELLLALRQFLPALLAEGFRFVPVSGLFAPEAIAARPTLASQEGSAASLALTR